MQAQTTINSKDTLTRMGSVSTDRLVRQNDSHKSSIIWLKKKIKIKIKAVETIKNFIKMKAVETI
jgi:hypothetical protein